MTTKPSYIVRVWGTKGLLETTERSLRACIALTWGLACRWEVVQIVDSLSWAFVGDCGDYANSDGASHNRKFWKQWQHSKRAFKCSLVKAAELLCIDGSIESVTPWLRLCKHDVDIAWQADCNCLGAV